MPYLGNNHIVGDSVNNFKVLDDISTHTATFDGSASSVVSTTNETIKLIDHRFVQGQRVTYNNGGGSNIGGLTSGTAYYVIYDTAHTIKLATSATNASSLTAINLNAVGSGTSHTLNVAFDGVNTKFRITHSSGNRPRFHHATQLSIAINNVIQKPNNDLNFTEGYAVEVRDIIVFKTAPTSNDIFFGSLTGETRGTFDITNHKIDNYTGDGSTTLYNLSQNVPNNESLLVSLNGVIQHPTTGGVTRSYSLVSGTTNRLQFTAAPASGVEIQIRHLGFAGASSGDVSGFYGRTGNVGLTSADHITTGDITSRNINSSGIITATQFKGDGSQLSGIDATALKDTSGNVKIQAVTSGALHTGVTTITQNLAYNASGTTYPLVVHADGDYKGILVNGNYAPTIGFNILNNTTPSWKLGLHGSSHHNFALSSGTGNTNKLIVQSTSNGGKGLFYGDWFATNLSMASTLYHDGDTDTGLTFDTDTINLHTGNTTRISITNSGASITGDLSVSGVLTYEDVTNVDSLGVGTFRNGLNVNTGTATTALVVQGDARVTGILTVGTGSLKITDRDIHAVGVVTGSNFKTGSTNVHSAGVEAAGINILGADTPIGAGATIFNSGDVVSKAGAEFQGIVTATQFKGDGSNLTGLASREFYGFTGIGNSLSLTTTNSGADNIDGATYAAFEESFTGPSGISFSINTSGNLIMSV